MMLPVAASRTTPEIVPPRGSVMLIPLRVSPLDTGVGCAVLKSTPSPKNVWMYPNAWALTSKGRLAGSGPTVYMPSGPVLAL
jgi:hypothetical protein